MMIHAPVTYVLECNLIPSCTCHLSLFKKYPALQMEYEDSSLDSEDDDDSVIYDSNVDEALRS